MVSAHPPRTPCWHCRYMVSVEARSTIVQYGRSGRISSFSRGGREGCDVWEREPGIDDDDWDPPGVPRIGPYVPEPPHVPRSRSRGIDGWWTEAPRPHRPAIVPKVVPTLAPERDPFGGMFNWYDNG